MSDDKKTTLLPGEQPLLLNHNYDGIKELDNPLPRWWLWILYGSMIFAVGYVGYYMVGNGPTQHQELAASMKALEALHPAPVPGAGTANIEALLAAYHDPAKLKAGADVFAAKCVSCHGDKGQGLIGPNLTDDFWIHGTGSLVDIAAVVTTGVADKGMPPWGTMLKADELTNVVAFVHSLHGSNPTGAKPPQGDHHDWNQE